MTDKIKIVTNVECVGSLLVNQDEMKEFSETLKETTTTSPKEGGAPHVNSKPDSKGPGLVRRITQKLMEPMSEEELEEIEDWTSYN